MNRIAVVFGFGIAQLFLTSFAMAGPPLPNEFFYFLFAIIFGIFLLIYVVLLLVLKYFEIPLKWHVHVTLFIAIAAFMITVNAWNWTDGVAIGIFIFAVLPFVLSVLVASKQRLNKKSSA